MRVPRILLIKSRSVITKNPGGTPPLGLLYVASLLQRETGAEIRLIDALFESDPGAAVVAAVRSMKPDVVGISALTAEAFPAIRIARAVKEASPGLPVVIGGPYASSDPDGATREPAVDVAVIGEGESTFLDLVRRIMEEGPYWREPATLRDVPGIAFRSEGQLLSTAPRPPLEDLDSIPFPAWDLIDYRRFWKMQAMATGGIRPYLPMFTSRGCPFKCVFCHQLFGKHFRGRSPESVADEVRTVLRRGATDVEILDDIANFRPERFDRMLELMLERDLHPVLSFPNALRCDMLEDNSLDLLKRVGVGEVSVAVETASPRLQKLMRKNLTLDRIRHVIDAMADRHIFMRGFFILGFPTETVEELLQTIRFAHSSRLHLAMFFTPTPFPNTELHDMFEASGKLPKCVNTLDYEYFGSPFNASEASDRLYRALYRWAYLGFYCSPGRMLRIARDRPRLSDAPIRIWGLIHKQSFKRLEGS